MNYQKRVEKIRKKFLEDGLDALLLTRGTDIRYLSGFTGEDKVAVLVLTEKKQFFITNGRFTNQAAMETENWEILLWRSGSSLYKETGLLLHQLQIKRAAVDIYDISHGSYQELSQVWEGSLEFCKPYVSNLRRVKEKEELELIKQACKITEDSFLAFLPKVSVGMTEMELRNILEAEFRVRGSEAVSFDTIVASGSDNGGNPHASLTGRKIEKGDMITVDFGAKYQGYCSDITRTFAVGKPDKKLQEIYQVVYEAKQAGRELLKCGVQASAVDGAIRSVIEQAGYSLVHGPGHGFGLDIHENPFLGPGNAYAMEEMVVHTLEPGIYVPGLGGVRIEDDYLIQKDGGECLTPQITEELIIL